MASYFKYVERNADSFVDWGSIGKSMSDMLQQENRMREEKKAALDESSRQLGETLTNATQGDHKGMNQWTLEYANNAQQARLLQDKLLKSGQLKLKDYLVQRQNLTDGTNQALSLVKEYQSEYSTKMERYKTDKSQDLEQWLMAQAEGFSNFNNTNLYINPTDGTVSVGKMVKNPQTGVMELSKDPNDFTTINALRNRIKATFDKFDVPSNIESFVQGLGTEINTLYQAATTARAGRLTNVLDITQRKNLPKNLQGVVMTFEEAETKKLESFLTNPLNVSSVLTNNVKFAPNGEQYTFTWNENEAKTKKNLILLKNNASGMPEPQFSQEQKNQAVEHLRLEARLRYDKKVEVQTTGQLQKQYAPEWLTKMNREDREKLGAAGAWNQLYTGKTAQEKQNAADILLGTPQAMALGLMAIDVTTPGQVSLKYKDPSLNRTISMLDESKNPISLSDFAFKGVELHGVKDRNQAMRAGGGYGTYGNIGTDPNTWKTIKSERAGVNPTPAP